MGKRSSPKEHCHKSSRWYNVVISWSSLPCQCTVVLSAWSISIFNVWCTIALSFFFCWIETKTNASLARFPSLGWEDSCGERTDGCTCWSAERKNSRSVGANSSRWHDLARSAQATQSNVYVLTVLIQIYFDCIVVLAIYFDDLKTINNYFLPRFHGVLRLYFRTQKNVGKINFRK